MSERPRKLTRSHWSSQSLSVHRISIKLRWQEFTGIRPASVRLSNHFHLTSVIISCAQLILPLKNIDWTSFLLRIMTNMGWAHVFCQHVYMWTCNCVCQHMWAFEGREPWYVLHCAGCRAAARLKLELWSSGIRGTENCTQEPTKTFWYSSRRNLKIKKRREFGFLSVCEKEIIFESFIDKLYHSTAL